MKRARRPLPLPRPQPLQPAPAGRLWRGPAARAAAAGRGGEDQRARSGQGEGGAAGPHPAERRGRVQGRAGGRAPHGAAGVLCLQRERRRCAEDHEARPSGARWLARAGRPPRHSSGLLSVHAGPAGSRVLCCARRRTLQTRTCPPRASARTSCRSAPDLPWAGSVLPVRRVRRRQRLECAAGSGRARPPALGPAAAPGGGPAAAGRGRAGGAVPGVLPAAGGRAPGRARPALRPAAAGGQGAPRRAGAPRSAPRTEPRAERGVGRGRACVREQGRTKKAPQAGSPEEARMLADMAVTTAHTKYRSTRFDMPSREELAAEAMPGMRSAVTRAAWPSRVRPLTAQGAWQARSGSAETAATRAPFCGG